MTPKVSSKSSFHFQNLFQVLSLLVLFCLSLGFLGINSFQTAAPANLVYCPLQKTWVKGASSQPKFETQTLDAICATDARKNSFQLELSLKTSRPVTENVFFDYLENGAKIFSALNKPDNSTPRQLLKQTNSEIAANNFSQNFDYHAPAELGIQPADFPQFSWKKVSAKFDFQRIGSLEKISRNINPRSPPFFV